MCHFGTWTYTRAALIAVVRFAFLFSRRTRRGGYTVRCIFSVHDISFTDASSNPTRMILHTLYCSLLILIPQSTYSHFLSCNGSSTLIMDNPADKQHCSSDNDGQNASGDPNSVEQILLNAEKLYNDDKLLQAARLLYPLIEDRHRSGSFNKVHLDILEKAQDCENFMTDIKSKRARDEESTETETGEHDGAKFGRWIKQSTTKCRDRKTDIHYMLDEETQSQLSLRVDTAVEKSLLIPLLSVLNESELYTTWLPSWSIPRMGIRACDKLSQTGRVSQVTVLTIDVPWPLQTREAVINAVGVDDIDERGEIVVRLKCLDTDADEDGVVFSALNNKEEVVQVGFEGGFVFRKYDMNIADGCEEEAADDDSSCTGGNDDEKEEDDLIMVSYQSITDAKLKHIPTPLLNFVLRTVVEMMWSNLLHVAEEVRDGARPLHAKLISDKREVLYDWLEQRVNTMLEF